MPSLVGKSEIDNGNVTPLFVNINEPQILKWIFFISDFTTSRVYKRPLGIRPYKNFIEETVKEAIDLGRSRNYSIKNAAEIKSIPRKTLENKIKNRHFHDVGAPTLLCPEIERPLVDVYSKILFR